jgi:hypothetical protein
MHPRPTFVESALCCPCLEQQFSLGSQTACTQCTSSTLPSVVVPGTGSQPSNTATASPNRHRFTVQQKNSIRGTGGFRKNLLLGSGDKTRVLDAEGGHMTCAKATLSLPTP